MNLYNRFATLPGMAKPKIPSKLVRVWVDTALLIKLAKRKDESLVETFHAAAKCLRRSRKKHGG